MASKKQPKEKKKKKKERLEAESTSRDGELETILDHIRPAFVEEGAKRMRQVDFQTVVQSRDAIRERFVEGTALGRFRDDVDSMLALLRDYRDGQYTTISLWSIAVMTFSFRYVLKPVDIIPDSLPVIGQLDDAMVVAHCVSLIRRDLQAYRIWSMVAEATD
jgi:uncharacterized membrane protein YkvA (DUF1232 family)